MITNREEVLEKAFKVFVKMNYEKASFTEIIKGRHHPLLSIQIRFICSSSRQICISNPSSE